MSDIDLSLPTKDFVEGSNDPPDDAITKNKWFHALQQIVSMAARTTAGKRLQANEVPDSGIGVISALADGASIDSLTTGSIRKVTSPTYTNSATLQQTPFANLSGKVCIVETKLSTSTQGYQTLAIPADFRKFIRFLQAGTWYGWYEIFNSYSDGNLGKPPAPKTYTSVASLAQNAYSAFTLVDGCTFLIVGWNATYGGSAVAIVRRWGTSLFLFGTIATHANVSIVLSGTDVRMTNLNAGQSDIHTSITQIAWI
jgi:hypothetical protein